MLNLLLGTGKRLLGDRSIGLMAALVQSGETN